MEIFQSDQSGLTGQARQIHRDLGERNLTSEPNYAHVLLHTLCKRKAK